MSGNITGTGPWIDVTQTIRPGLPVWPGDPPVEERPLMRIAQGDVANVTRFLLGSHTGTHIDPPRHFEPEGATVDALDLDTLCGPCRVVDLSHLDRAITAEDLASFDAAAPERLLLRTRNGARQDGPFREDFIALAPDTAAWCVRHGVRLIGIDGPSIESYATEDFAVHHALLGAGLIVVEGLELEGVTPGVYEMVCAPLKWRDADGAPARVLLRSIPASGVSPG